MPMIQPSDIEYRRFTDEQVQGIVCASGICFSSEHQNWRTTLDDAAKDLLFDLCAKEWPAPSAMLKELRRIESDPDAFLDRIDADEDSSDSPVMALILRPDRHDPFPAETDRRARFLNRINDERQKLDRVVANRKAMKLCGHTGSAELQLFIERLTWVFKDAFHQNVNDGLIVPTDGSSPSGHFIKFAKAALVATADNLSKALQNTIVEKTLRSISIDSNTAVWNRLIKTDSYRLATELKRICRTFKT